MKTYDEVIQGLCYKRDELEKAKVCAEEIRSRYKNLVQEIEEHPMTKLLMNELLGHLIDKLEMDAMILIPIMNNLREVVLNSFYNGLIIGIEMEKESVPHV